MNHRGWQGIDESRMRIEGRRRGWRSPGNDSCRENEMDRWAQDENQHGRRNSTVMATSNNMDSALRHTCVFENEHICENEHSCCAILLFLFCQNEHTCAWMCCIFILCLFFF